MSPDPHTRLATARAAYADGGRFGELMDLLAAVDAVLAESPDAPTGVLDALLALARERGTCLELIAHGDAEPGDGGPLYTLETSVLTLAESGSAEGILAHLGELSGVELGEPPATLAERQAQRGPVGTIDESGAVPGVLSDEEIVRLTPERPTRAQELREAIALGRRGYVPAAAPPEWRGVQADPWRSIHVPPPRHTTVLVSMPSGNASGDRVLPAIWTGRRWVGAACELWCDPDGWRPLPEARR